MYRKLLILAATLPLGACMTTGGVVANDVPPCERMVPPSLLEKTPPADMPISAKLPDGHDDARPWQAGFIEQTAAYEIADSKAPAVDHIYRECLRIHAERLAKDTAGFFRRIFGR